MCLVLIIVSAIEEKVVALHPKKKECMYAGGNPPNVFVGADPDRNLGGKHSGNCREMFTGYSDGDPSLTEENELFQERFIKEFDTAEKQQEMTISSMNSYVFGFGLNTDGTELANRTALRNLLQQFKEN